MEVILDVELLIVNKAHFDLDYHGGPGIKITPEVKGKDAQIHVETWTNTADGSVEITLMEADGTVVTKATGTEVSLEVQNVHLWDGLDDPYLYTVKAVLSSNGKFSINLYTILFIIFFGIGYGAYYSTADMPIPMVADCSDYETYRSGKYIPGIMGTLFSLVDKLVSSLSATIVGIAVSVIGLQNLPTAETPYAPGMNRVVIVLFCVIPMIAWAATLICMKGYELTGARMKEIQAVNAKRKEAIANGMTMEEAMEKYK